MKKIILMFFALCVLAQGFSQMALTPKKKKVSPQFEKLTKYELTNNNEPVFNSTQYGIPVTIHLENSDDGILYYASQGQFKADMQTISKGTIVAGYSNNKIFLSVFIFDYSNKEFGMYFYEPPAGRNFLLVEKSRFTLDELIETLIEDKTDIKWIKDEL